MSRALISATLHERHGYNVTVALTADPAPGQPLDTTDVVYQMHAAAHRLAAELWGLASKAQARWAIDVSYARVTIELTADESVHAALSYAQDACQRAGISLLAPARARPPAKTGAAKREARALPPLKRRARAR